MNPWVKHVLEVAIAVGGVAQVSRHLRRGRGLVLAYHNIVPPGEKQCGERSLHLPFRDFTEQLDGLQRTHDVVPLDALFDDSQRRNRPRAALTFDDGYRGTVTAAVEELARRGMPATIFVPTKFVGRPSFWWDAIAEESGEIPEPIRDRAIGQMGGDDDTIRDWAVQTNHPLLTPPEHAQPATEEELRTATRVPGITLGSHSWSHRNLTTLTDAELRVEMERPLQWLRERFDSVVDWYSYPYGLTSDRVASAAASAGYRAALSQGRGWVPPSLQDVYRVRRFNVPAGISRHGFALHTSGVL